MDVILGLPATDTSIEKIETTDNTRDAHIPGTQ